MMLIGRRIAELEIRLTANWPMALRKFKEAVEGSGNGCTIEIDSDNDRLGLLTMPADWPFLEDVPGVGSHWKIYPNYYTNG